MCRSRVIPALAVALVLAPAIVSAQAAIDAVATGRTGHLLLVGGGSLPDDVVKRFVELAGGRSARLVVIPTASERADAPDAAQRYLPTWLERGVGHAVLLHTRDREEADREDFTAPLRDATAVWIGGGAQGRIADAYAGTRVESELLALLARGGVVGGTSAGAACASPMMIVRGRDPAETGRGLDLLRGVVVDQHFAQRERQARLADVLVRHPGLFGIGIDESTAIEVHERTVRVLGRGQACVMLAPAADGSRAASAVAHGAGATFDLVRWRRAAQARAVVAGEDEVPRVPERTTLVLAGAGQAPRQALERFVAAAGGASVAMLVLSDGEDRAAADAIAAALRGAGAVQVAVEHDAARVARHSVGGVWFAGGAPWRWVDAFDAPALREWIGALWHGGGAVAGSAAGAAVIGERLLHADPTDRGVVLAEGYDRGLGLLARTAIGLGEVAPDALRGVVVQEPRCLGLGIGDATAIVVRGTVLEVVGSGPVAVVSPRTDREPGAATAPQTGSPPQITALGAGESFDLANGTRLR